MANTDSSVNDCIQVYENIGNEQQSVPDTQHLVKLPNSTIVSKEDSLSSSCSERDCSSQSDAESNAPTSKGLTSSHETKLQLQPVRFLCYGHPNIMNELTKNSTFHRSTQVNQQNWNIPAKAESYESKQLPPVGTIIRYSIDDIVPIKPDQIHLIPTISKAGEKAAPIRRLLKSILKRPIKAEENSTPVTTTTLKRKNKENVLPVTPSKVQKLEKPDQVTMANIKICSTLSLPEISNELCDTEEMLLGESKSNSF